MCGGLLGGQNENEQEEGQHRQQQEGYRTIVPISLVLTGITTLLFPIAAKIDGSGVNSNGPTFAILDRFVLGLLEGLLLPAAMSGVSATTTNIASTVKTMVTSDGTGNFRNNNNKATASSIVIAGCYLGSAWAYLSAWILFSEASQVLLHQWDDVLSLQHGHDQISVWPMLFYINGSMASLHAHAYLFPTYSRGLPACVVFPVTRSWQDAVDNKQ